MRANIILMAVTVIFCLLIVEITLRINRDYMTYPEKTGGGYVSPYSSGKNDTWYRTIKPNTSFSFKQKEFVFTGKANNEGFDDNDFILEKTGLRIIILGDSYTEGVGADQDSSFPRRLSYLLMSDTFAGGIQVWNCGISGSDPIYEFRLFRDKLLRYNPDMVIVAMNFSDIHDVMIGGGFERFRSDGTVQLRSGPWFESLYEHSYIFRGIIHDLLGYNWEFVSPWEVKRVRQIVYNQLQGAIDSFATVCKERHIKPLFVFHNNENEMRDKVEYQMMPLIRYCEGKKLPYVDILEELHRLGVDSANAKDLFWKEDGHCNNMGYSYFARSIYPRVLEELKH